MYNFTNFYKKQNIHRKQKQGKNFIYRHDFIICNHKNDIIYFPNMKISHSNHIINLRFF